MIALVIITTWLTLTAAGFAGLSALRRVGAREDHEVGRAAVAPAELSGLTRVGATMRVATPRALLR